jgi:hypothetical protein
MEEELEGDGEGGFLRFVRACIYNRWFYASLCAVSVLDVGTDVAGIIHPGPGYFWATISLVASGVVAVLTATIFLDLQFRRGRQ